MEKMSLYKIDANMQEILEKGFVVDEETGEIIFDTEDLNSLEMAEADKINNIIGYLKDLEIQANNLKEIEKEYSDRRKQKEKKVKHLKSYLDGYLQLKGMTDKREYTNGITSYRSSKSVNITDEAKLIEYLKNNQLEDLYETEYKVNKTNIKKEIEQGNDIQYAEIIESKNLQIK